MIGDILLKFLSNRPKPLLCWIWLRRVSNMSWRKHVQNAETGKQSAYERGRMTGNYLMSSFVWIA